MVMAPTKERPAHCHGCGKDLVGNKQKMKTKDGKLYCWECADVLDLWMQEEV